MTSVCFHIYITQYPWFASLFRGTKEERACQIWGLVRSTPRLFHNDRIRSQIPLIVRELIWMFWHATIMSCGCFNKHTLPCLTYPRLGYFIALFDFSVLVVGGTFYILYLQSNTGCIIDFKHRLWCPRLTVFLHVFDWIFFNVLVFSWCYRFTEGGQFQFKFCI